MSYSNPFTLDTVRIPVDKIVDREEQVQFLNERVIRQSENLLLTGPFGIGKTCLLRKFRAQIDSVTPEKTLLIEMEMRRVSSDASEFLSDVLLKLVGVFWSQVLKRPYSQLLQSVSNPREAADQIIPQVRTILDLYRILRPERDEAVLKTQNTIGLDKIVKATKQEDVNRTVVRGALTPSEFIELAEELLRILGDEGIERTIVFGDEANHIDQELELELFHRNFEVFAKRNVQFVLTAKEEVIDKVLRIRDAFPTWLSLPKFHASSVLDEIIDTYSENILLPEFTSRAREYIWRITDANPRELQRLCQACATIAINKSAGSNAVVDVEVVLDAVASKYLVSPK